MHTFRSSQFNYCPLVGMFCARKINNMIDHIYEKTLRVASKNATSDYNKRISVHTKNLQLLMTEVYNTKSNLNPSFMKEIFIKKNRCSLLLSKVKTTLSGLESISYLRSRLWQKLSNEMKGSKNLSIFKKYIKSWKGEDYSCRLCKNYVAQVGFLETQ